MNKFAKLSPANLVRFRRLSYHCWRQCSLLHYNVLSPNLCLHWVCHPSVRCHNPRKIYKMEWVRIKPTRICRYVSKLTGSNVTWTTIIAHVVFANWIKECSLSIWFINNLSCALHYANSGRNSWFCQRARGRHIS